MVYISHRMEEIFEICDSYSVMRDGAYIAGGMIRDVTVDKLIEYMVGRSLSQVFPGKHNVIGDIVLEARDISSGTEVRNVSFYLKQGEILGFAGLVGAGRTETLKAVFGRRPEIQGTDNDKWQGGSHPFSQGCHPLGNRFCPGGQETGRAGNGTVRHG